MRKTLLLSLSLSASTTTAAKNNNNNNNSLRSIQRNMNARIFNGQTVEDADRYPYFAMLDGFPSLCGGVLIAPDVVVTAAHCKDVSDSVIIGRSNKVDYENDGSETLGVASQIFFPLWPNPTNNKSYDLMLIKLSSPSTKQPLKLGFSTPTSLDYLTTVGFGMLTPGRLVFSSTLQQADLNHISNDQCQELHGIDDIEISSDMMCAHQEGTSTCYGDGGGPLLIQGATPAEDILVGTISHDACDTSTPGIFASIPFFYDWIIQTTCTVSENPPEYMGCGAVGALEGGWGAAGGAPQTPTNPLDGPVIGTLQFVTWDPTDLLGLCQGDCGTDADCEGDLICFQLDGNAVVPGCQKGGWTPSVSDFCVNPVAVELHENNRDLQYDLYQDSKVLRHNSWLVLMGVIAWLGMIYQILGFRNPNKNPHDKLIAKNSSHSIHAKSMVYPPSDDELTDDDLDSTIFKKAFRRSSMPSKNSNEDLHAMATSIKSSRKAAADGTSQLTSPRRRASMSSKPSVLRAMMKELKSNNDNNNTRSSSSSQIPDSVPL